MVWALPGGRRAAGGQSNQPEECLNSVFDPNARVLVVREVCCRHISASVCGVIVLSLSVGCADLVAKALPEASHCPRCMEAAPVAGRLHLPELRLDAAGLGVV